KSAAVSIFLRFLTGIASIQSVQTVASAFRQEKPNQKRYLGPTVEYDSDSEIATLGNPRPCDGGHCYRPTTSVTERRRSQSSGKPMERKRSSNGGVNGEVL